VLIEAVVVDLDDTLYAQQSWLRGAWAAVARAGPACLPATVIEEALLAVAAEGSDRGHIIDRALDRLGIEDVDVGALVEVFRAHAPSRLVPFPGVTDGLASLRTRVPVGLVTDGDPHIQRAKLRALGLAEAFDTVVFSDELGRVQRKPHRAPFVAAATALRVRPDRCVFVGDRPDKDVMGAAAADYLGTVRVLTGEYRGAEPVPCLATVNTFADAVAWIDREYLRRVVRTCT
jgi:putative hydrolase of the HAD superfamily